MYLFLFDIDGTLINSGGAGKKALERVFYEIYEIKDAMDGIIPDGKTDVEIIKEMLKKKVNIDKIEDGMVDIIVSMYLKYLEETINNPDYKVISGAKEYVQKVYYSKENLLGLATGNIEIGAKIKLKSSGLLKFFKFGAFGSDAEDRVEILKIAKERACRITDEEIERVYVIGDTPKDIEAAKKADFISVGVATGNYSMDELWKKRPDFLFSSLMDPDAIKLLKNWEMFS